MNIIVPPVKCQGIKTKIVPKIRILQRDKKYRRWVEPFMGSGVVAFNILPENALLCDTNPHLISFYTSLKSDEITEESAREYLRSEGEKLRVKGESHYYYIRDRFNSEYSPMDFLFLNRACFNGMIRFNNKGAFNVPFCRKPERFAQAYITKIVNQIGAVRKIIKTRNFEFICQDFRKTFSSLTADDFIYCDPPYIDRHTDYFNQWNEKDETDLLQLLIHTPSHFLLSTWQGNEFRENKYVKSYSEFFYKDVQEHFYYIGGDISNRHIMNEALFHNYPIENPVFDIPELEQPLLNL